jgi:hypothetical protein
MNLKDKKIVCVGCGKRYRVPSDGNLDAVSALDKAGWVYSEEDGADGGEWYHNAACMQLANLREVREILG